MLDKNKSKTAKQGMSDRTFNAILMVIVTFILVIVLYPMIYVLSSSFSSGTAVSEGRVLLWPVDFSLFGYKWVFANKLIWIGYKNSIIYTVFGALYAITMTICAAYPLSRRNYQGKTVVQALLTVTMLFSGGLVPTYLVISKLGLVNNPFLMIINGGVGITYIIMMRTNFQNVPYELLESAKMDGISDIGYLLKIVLPLSKAIISVICLYSVVSHWNSYFTPMLYLREREYYPLNLVLSDILNKAKPDTSYMGGESSSIVSQTQASIDAVKYACIIVGVVPMLIIYPFVQKFFEKGVTVGSIKG